VGGLLFIDCPFPRKYGGKDALEIKLGYLIYHEVMGNTEIIPTQINLDKTCSNGKMARQLLSAFGNGSWVVTPSLNHYMKSFL
jgi:hypothetical protein